MAFLHRIGKSNLKIASFQFRRCYYVQLPHAPSLNSNPPMEMPHPQSFFHGRLTTVFNSVRFFAAPVQFQVKHKKEEDDCTSGPRLNEKIKAPYVRVVWDDGRHEPMSRIKALEEAKKLNLDLVEVDKKGKPPACKIMDYHKEKYKRQEKDKERAKSKADSTLRSGLKEMRFTEKTESKDLKTKADMVKKLMEKGYRVKVRATGSIENSDLKISLSRLHALIEDICVVESGPSLTRKEAFMIVRHVKYGLAKKGGKKFQDAAQMTFESQEDDMEPLTADSNDSFEYEDKSSAESWFETGEEVLSVGDEHIVTPTISENRNRRADAQVPPAMSENRYRTDARVPPAMSENRYRRPDAQVPPAMSENRYRRPDAQVSPAMSENRYRRPDAQVPPAMSENRYRRPDAQVPPAMSENRYRRPDAQVPPAMSENRYRRPDAQAPPAMSENRGKRPDAQAPPAMSENRGRRPDAQAPPATSENRYREADAQVLPTMSENRYRRADQPGQNNVQPNAHVPPSVTDTNRYTGAEPRNRFQQTSNNSVPENNQGAGIRNPFGSIPSNSNQPRHVPQDINFIPKVENTKQGVNPGSRNFKPSSHEGISRHPSAPNNTPKSSYGIFSK